jgi:hypothetical protein
MFVRVTGFVIQALEPETSALRNKCSQKQPPRVSQLIIRKAVFLSSVAYKCRRTRFVGLH